MVIGFFSLWDNYSFFRYTIKQPRFGKSAAPAWLYREPMLWRDCLATIGVSVFRCADFGWRTFYFGGITMFCSKCGKEIDNEAVVCVHCGCPTQNYQNDKQTKDQPIIINNNNSASSSAAAAAAAGGRVRRKHSLLFDLFMICITGGLWIIWMILRPKYY